MQALHSGDRGKELEKLASVLVIGQWLDWSKSSIHVWSIVGQYLMSCKPNAKTSDSIRPSIQLHYSFLWACKAWAMSRHKT